MNTADFIDLFSHLDRGWLRRVIDQDRELSPQDRALLGDALEDEEVMGYARTSFLIFRVLSRSKDDFAKQCAASLARRSEFFGGLSGYVAPPEDRHTVIGDAYAKLEAEFDTEQGIMEVLRLSDDLVANVMERVEFASGGEKWYSAYYDYVNGYMIMGNARSVHHREMFERIEKIFGSVTPPMMRILMGSGFSKSSLRIAAIRVGESDPDWTRLTNGLLEIFEPHVHYVNRADEGELLFLINEKPRREGVSIEYGSGVITEGVGGDFDVRSTARAVVTLARNLHAYPIVRVSKMIEECGDGTMAFLERTDSEDLAFRPPFMNMISLQIDAGTDVTISTRGPSARILLHRISSFLGTTDDEGGGGGSSPGGGAASGGGGYMDSYIASGQVETGASIFFGNTLGSLAVAVASMNALMAMPA